MPLNAVSVTDSPSQWAAERAQMLAERSALQARIAQLEHQLAWFQRQLFGEKSERRHIEPRPDR